MRNVDFDNHLCRLSSKTDLWRRKTERQASEGLLTLLKILLNVKTSVDQLLERKSRKENRENEGVRGRSWRPRVVGRQDWGLTPMQETWASHPDNAESRMSYINYHHRTAFGTRFHFLVVRICNILEEKILIWNLLLIILLTDPEKLSNISKVKKREEP